MSPPRSTASETDRARRLYDKSAGRYDRQIGFFERLLFEGGRAWVCSRAQGETLEIAFGTARNLPFYPAGVRLSGVELSPEMVSIAHQRQQALGRNADLRVGDAQSMPFGEASFDTVVSTLTLCTIPDPALAAGEAFRVLRPGGRFVLLEHVRSPAKAVRAVQRVLDPLTVRLMADHLHREPLAYLTGAGFEIEELERSKWGIVERASLRKPE